MCSTECVLCRYKILLINVPQEKNRENKGRVLFKKKKKIAERGRGKTT